MKRYIIFILLLIGKLAFAQKNLIPNGSFETYSRGRVLNWRFSQYLNFEKTTDAKDGKYAAKFWANGGSINLIDKDYNYNVISIEENTEYKFSFWYKGEIFMRNSLFSPMKNITTIITWFKDEERIKSEFRDNDNVIATSQWQKKEIILQVPPGANKMGISFNIKIGDGYGILDDVSLVFSKKIAPPLPAPTNFVATPHQREIELSWDREADESIAWEIVVDDRQPVRTTHNRYTVEDLQINKSYLVKVRAVRGEAKSEFTKELKINTENFNRTKESIERVPHLRTLGNSAQIPKTIRLYYNDLINKDAVIKYFIDGIEFFPQNRELTFPKLGQQKLNVSIDEGENYQWELEYDVNVR